MIATARPACDAARLFAAEDDPVRLSDLQLDAALKRDPAVLAQGVQSALVAEDLDLAQSFVDVASARDVALPSETVAQLDAARAAAGGAAAVAARFATGFATGQGQDLAGLAGAFAGDLTVYGDLRDLAREGKRAVAGEAADPLLIGLASAGLAVTAGTYASLGAGAPLRSGLTLLKSARRAGAVGPGLAAWAKRSVREAAETPRLEKQLSSARPGAATGLVRAARDVSRVSEKAGVRAALDVVKIADGPADIARAARLAAAKGGQTRALLKLFGRGALLIAAGAFNLAVWLLGALFFLFSIVSSIKATAERLTQAWLHRRRNKRMAQTTAAMASLPIASVAA